MHVNTHFLGYLYMYYSYICLSIHPDSRTAFGLFSPVMPCQYVSRVGNNQIRQVELKQKQKKSKKKTEKLDIKKRKNFQDKMAKSGNKAEML